MPKLMHQAKRRDVIRNSDVPPPGSVSFLYPIVVLKRHTASSPTLPRTLDSHPITCLQLHTVPITHVLANTRQHRQHELDQAERGLIKAARCLRCPQKAPGGVQLTAAKPTCWRSCSLHLTGAGPGCWLKEPRCLCVPWGSGALAQMPAPELHCRGAPDTGKRWAGGTCAPL